jgi:Pyruvate/2-oxoacid:ferredoxin oxidoreductase delta subunit
MTMPRACADTPVITVTEAWCKGCEICVRVCADGCLEMNERGTVDVANAEACTRCGLCELYCPDFAIDVR